MVQCASFASLDSWQCREAPKLICFDYDIDADPPGRPVPLRSASTLAPESLDTFIRGLALAGTQGLPCTVAGLERMGLPRDRAEALRAVIASGHDERQVVEAFLEAVARWADDAASPLSRHLRRAVLHLFADEAQGADVRALVRVIVDAWGETESASLSDFSIREGA
jgi:hypothetical protein